MGEPEIGIQPGAGDAARVGAAALAERMRAVARAQQRLNVAIARRMGLAPNDVWALEHLFAAGPLGPVELARRLGITSASATVLVDRLEAAGYVERRPHPGDRRRLVVAPTVAAGPDATAALAPFLAELDAAGADLTPAEQAAVARYLDTVAAALARYADAVDPR